MKTETMTPAWVVGNFLPECESRYRSMYPRGEYDDMEMEQWEEFCTDNFPEALLGLLKAQREECYEAWHSAIAEKGEPYYERIATAIRNSPIPEPKNRK